MTRRRETLRAISMAAAVLEQSRHRDRTSFDIIGAVAARNVPLLFRPLDKLWGAFITVNDEARGIIVTTKLGLPVQRFTVAHELGHLLLGHRSSLDETVGFAGRNGPASRPIEEVAADTFASEVLAPKGLLIASARRHCWTRAKLRQPAHIYQLALASGHQLPSRVLGVGHRQRPDTPRSRSTPIRGGQAPEASLGVGGIHRESLGRRLGAH